MSGINQHRQNSARQSGVSPIGVARLALMGAAVALGPVVLSAWALAQQAPESLLPPGFDRPVAHPARPAPTRVAAPVPAQMPKHSVASPAAHAPAPPRAATQTAPRIIAPSILASPLIVPEAGATASATQGPGLPAGITSFEQLAALPQDQLDALLGLRPSYEMAAGGRHTLSRVGVIGADEGGLPPFSLARQDGALVGAALAGNHGAMVSRWGHILLRRVLASRLDAPLGMDPASFAAQRAALLSRMGEGEAARALVQDVDPGSYTPELTQAAFDAYVATEDFTGICPVAAVQGAERRDGGWQVFRAICAVFSGNGSVGFAQLDRLTYQGAMPHIDMLLAQKYAGAAGRGRRAVTIEWSEASDMTPWRHALAIATGLTPPAALLSNAGPSYDYVSATAPMLGLGLRADASDHAGGAGILSAAAMVDLYSQIYADDGVSGGAADRALLLRDAYVAEDPADRLKAMRKLWDGGASPLERYARQVLTAYAAARLPASSGFSGDSGDIIAAMLAAGLDANALRWGNAVDKGSQGWALLALASPKAAMVDSGTLDTYRHADSSTDNRKSAFLLAGLAGLGRVSDGTRRSMAGTLSLDLDRQSHWTTAIDQAAQAGNPTLVALLAGLGMQGDSWQKMTPRYLYHIVGALNRVGLGAEARMIAAEAVARG